jgi:NADH:ubiquinone oxidoreductase subunit 4 (subunit M)
VQRVFWNPLVHDENKKLTDVRPSEFLAAATLVVLMVWIGVRPNDVLERIRPAVETLQKSVAAKQVALHESARPEVALHESAHSAIDEVRR